MRLLYAWLLGQTAALVIFIIIIWPSKMPSVLGLGADAHLLVLAIAAGFLGSSLASLAEVLDDPRGVTKNELPLIVALPVFGAGIALIFYIALRGGILSITISDAAAVEVINPYGLAAFSGIVGLFVNKAVFKLGVVSDALFGITESERRARGIMESEGRAEGTGEKGSK